ncbi:MAG: ATP-dependent DNA helicase RecG [Geminicoccaceae bacterium]
MTTAETAVGPQDLDQTTLPAKAAPGDLRPALLDPLFAPVSSLPGVGPAFERMLVRLLGRQSPRLIDLVAHLPTGVIDPRPIEPPLGQAVGNPVTVRVELGRHVAPPRSGRQPYRIEGSACGEPCDLLFFKVFKDSVERRFPTGSEVVVHGVLGRFRDRWQIVHPEPLDGGAAAVPLYPLTEGLGRRRLAGLLRTACMKLPALPEWLPAERCTEENWPDWVTALRRLHAPETPEACAVDAPGRRRLAFDELLASQIAVAIGRAQRDRLPGRALPGDGHLNEALHASLPFPLTSCQTRAIAEIRADLASSRPMLRLLQGDVGSGKTVVALFAMLQAIESGAQAALMAPTEVLARQHHATLARLAGPLGIEVALITGQEPVRSRSPLLTALADGTIRLAVGTHALLQERVAFADLGLAVIDEQHRFGVGQRLGLAGKGAAVDLLLMSATPIPRTLLLALHGDLDVSNLRAKPPGRQPVVTRALPADRLEEVVAACERTLAEGGRIYWICPVVEPSEGTEMVAAVERHDFLRERFGAAVGLVHGRLDSRTKAEALAAFASGGTRLLVATTVVEVGVDVPEACVIVVEHAERFGLAQLHQLRGRVGRGGGAAHCLLLYAPPLSPFAAARLRRLRETDDGFKIAEADLKLRGPGEALGTRQSGLPAFRFADLAIHADLLPLARDEAAALLRRNPQLANAEGEKIRILLHLYDRQTAMRNLTAG